VKTASEHKEKFAYLLSKIEAYFTKNNIVFKKKSNVFWITYSKSLFAIKFEPFRFNTDESFHFTIVIGLFDPIYADLVSSNKNAKKIVDCIIIKDLLDFGAMKEGFELQENSDMDVLSEKCIDVLKEHYIPYIIKMVNPIEFRAFLINNPKQLTVQLVYCCYLLNDNKRELAQSIMVKNEHLLNNYWRRKIMESKCSGLLDLI